MTMIEGMTLTDFFLARVAEDEAAVNRLLRHDAWYPREGQPQTAKTPLVRVRHWELTPARVLAECEAKRRIMDEVFENAWGIDGEWGNGHTAEQIRAGECEDQGWDAARRFLQFLALPYADHPDYDESWRP